MIKNYFRILKKTHAYLQTILKTPVKFQKDRPKTVGGVKGTKYPLKTRNHAPRTTHHVPRTTHHAPRATHHAPRKTKNSVPPLFFEKAGDIFFEKAGDNKEKIINLSSAELAQGVVKLKTYRKQPLNAVQALDYPALKSKHFGTNQIKYG